LEKNDVLNSGAVGARRSGNKCPVGQEKMTTSGKACRSGARLRAGHEKADALEDASAWGRKSAGSGPAR